MTADPAADHAAFTRILEERRLGAVFQPLVHLDSGELVGFEALARGPEGTPFASPGVLFGHADELGRTVELDWACRAAAFEAYLAADVPPAMSLFVNVEIASLMEACPEDLLAVVGRAEASLRVFIEINDRALAADPAGLLTTVDRAREMGWGVSIDDIGTSLGCLSVLPMVRADVVKLDVGRLGLGEGEAVSPVLATVLRHVEETGATPVVKGIESESDMHLARALGARYGQGHHLGSPAALDENLRAPRTVVPLLDGWAGPRAVDDPFDLAAGRDVRRMTRASMEDLARLLAAGAFVAGSHPVVLVVLAEHVALAMIGRRAPGTPGSVDVAVTQEPQTVCDVAQHLIRRIPPLGAHNEVLPASAATVAQAVADEPVPEAPTPVEQPHGRAGWFARRHA